MNNALKDKILYHFTLCPFSRQARIAIKESNLNCTLINENYWNRNKSFLSINPSGELPVLVNENITICGIYPITEYLHENYISHFFSNDNDIKAEVRRLLHWINFKFYREVTKYILDEKIIRILSNAGSPRSIHLRTAKENFAKHLVYFTNLIEQREFIATDKLTSADFALAAHISVLDFFNEIQWFDIPTLKHWYSLIKSRPSFRPILTDRFPGFNAPIHYLELDF